VYSVISVIVDSLPGNTKNRESTRSWTDRVRLVHSWAVSRHHSSLDGYFSTVQGLLDWFEVDLGFTEPLLIHIDLCVMCVFVLYSLVLLSRQHSRRCHHTHPPHTHKHKRTLTHTISLSLSISHAVSPSLSLTHTHICRHRHRTHALTHTHTHKNMHVLSLSLSLTHTHTHL